MRRINYKSDIPPLLLSLKVDEKQITVPDCDFLVRFYIDGYEGRHYDCSHIGGAWSNCEPSEDGTKLVCYINNQRLGIGELCAEFHYMSPDRRYSDGSQKSVVVIGSTELGVELVEDNGDAVTEAAIDVTLPFIYRTAYEIARDHGYTGTAEDFYGALASVVGIADAEKKRVTAEITRNANEQERIENEENRLNAESGRVNAEAQRVRNEAIRGEGENMRIEQEEDRKAKFEEITEFIATVRANEGNRESNERERQTNEDARITEEAKRVEAEKKRAAEFEQQKLDLTGKIDRSGDEMGGDLIFTDNAGVSFSTSDGGAHTMFNDTDDVAKFTADNGDTFEFTQENTPNKSSSAIVVSANLYSALDMTLDSMGSALDGDAAYRVEAGDTIFNPDTCKIQRYNSTVGGFEDLCDPIEGKLYANKLTGYIYRWEQKTKKMVFVGGVKAYTKDEADSRFAKLKDETQTVNVKELNANNFVSAKSMWIGDEGLLLGGDGNGHLTVEEDEVITDVTLNEKLKGKADDVAIGVEWENGKPSGQLKEMTVKEATSLNATTALIAGFSYDSLSREVEKKADKTELNNYATKEYVQTNAPQETKESIEEKLGAWLEDDGGEADGEVYTKAESDALLSGKVNKSDIVQSTGTSETAVMSQKSVTDALSKSGFALLYELGFSDLRHFYASRVDADTATYYVDDGIPDWVRTCPMINNRYALNIDRFFTDNSVDVENKKYTKHIKSTYVWIEIIDNNSFVAYTSYAGTVIAKIEDASTVGEFAFCEIAKGFKLDITGLSTVIFEIDKSVKNVLSSRYGLNGQVYTDLLVYRERGNKYYTPYNNVNNIRGYAYSNCIASSSYSNLIKIKRGNGNLEIEQAKINSSTLDIAATVNAVYENSVPLINPFVSDIQDEEKLYLSPLVYSYSSPLPYTPHTTIKVYGKK